MTKVVAFIGAIGAGKSTAAHAFKPGVYRQINFADTLKDMLQTLGLTEEEVDGQNKEEPSSLLGGRTPRYAMQTLGHEWGRSLIHRDLWVLSWYIKARKHSHVVVADMRYPNEYEAVKDLGGIVVHIDRQVPHDPSHPSEQFWPQFPCDHRIVNDGSVNDLCFKIYQLAREIG